jgi:glycosyltransferase involved in cell wall biosynthesis
VIIDSNKPKNSAFKNIFFDLTELFIASSKFKHYGIAKVVAEMAIELYRTNSGARYVIYSPGHQNFFEIFPTISPSEKAPEINLNIPSQGSPLWVRHKLMIGLIFRKINVYRWKKAGISLNTVSLSNSYLISAGRPKFIADYLNILTEKHVGAKLVPFLHDVLPLMDYANNKKDRFAKEFLKDNTDVINIAHFITCNSHFTKSEIEKCQSMGLLPPKKIQVVQLAHECREGNDDPNIQLPSAPYVLCVGSTRGRKNVECAINALLELTKKGEKTSQLVLAGVQRKRIINYLESAQFAAIRERIILINNPNQTDLVRLYRNALALILPSKAEGWGLPAGEALWLGTPSLCADIPVLKEVCGQLGLYFDPENPKELANWIEKLLNDQAFTCSQRELISEHHKELRTWRNVAEALYLLL